MRIGAVVSADRIDAALAAGVDYLEPTIANGLAVHDGDTWGLAEAFHERRYPSFALLFPGDLALADPRVPLDPVWAYLDAVLPLIASVAEPGARIVFGSGTARRIPDDVDRSDGEKRFADAVRGTRDRATAHGLEIALEPLSRSETNLLHTIDESVRFLDEHGLESVRINADLFHMMSAEEPIAAVSTHADRIAHAHLADGDRRFIGVGGAPWRAFLAALTASGYAGDVSLECTWGDDAASELRASVENVRAALG